MMERLLKIGFWTALLIAGAAVLGAFTVIGTEGEQRFWSLIAAGIVLGGFGGLCLFLKSESQLLALIYFAAFLVAVFGANLYLDLQPRPHSLVDKLLELRAENSLAVPRIWPATFLERGSRNRPIRQQVVRELDGKVPISGIANRTTVNCSEKKGIWAIYESDRHGFNNPDSAWDEATEIVAVGDSFTNGACVPSGKGMVDLMRSRFPGTINLALDSNGPILMLATLREFASILQPRIVLWFFYEGNDLLNLDEEIVSSPHRFYLDPGFQQGLFQLQPKIDAALSAAVEQLLAQAEQGKSWGQRIVNALLLRNLRSALFIHSGNNAKNLTANKAKNLTGRIDLLRNVLAVANADVAAWGGRLCFVYLPTWGSFFQPNDQLKEQRQKTLDAVESLGITVIDIHPVFAKLVESGQGEVIFYEPHSHYSEFGYAAVARTLLTLEEGKNFSCGS